MKLKCFGSRNENFHCKIVFLDETELLQEIQSTTRGQDLLDVAFKHLNLLETAYFGLRYLDATNQTHWLDPTKKVAKQLKGTEQFTLYFGVKFYSSDPCKLLEEITRYQFFLQVKQDVLQGRLPVAFDLAAELGAYAVQSELGDFDPRRHQIGYIAEFRFITPQTHELESRISDLHKSVIGQVPAVAELNYLDKVKWLDMYGVDLHPVLGEDNVEYFLGLTPSGVIVLRNRTKVGNYFWPRITKVYFKGKYFMLRVRDKNNDENTYGFELPSKQACKHLWKCCVEHHAFFRLTQVSSTNSGKMFSLTSRFSSGRSDRQVEPESPAVSRLQPTVTRVSSRRFNRRLGQPDGIDNSLKEDNREGERIETRSNLSIPQPIHLGSGLYKAASTPNTAALPDSPRSTRSAPWEDPRQRGLFSSSTNPSPRSVRSAGHKQSSRSHSRHRSPSADSEDSCDSRRKRHHPHSSHHSSGRHRHDKRHQSRRNSDNDSERSQGSHSRSHSRKQRERSNSRHRESGSDSEPSQRHRHRGRKHRSATGSNYELVDSEAQWKEVQSKQQKVSSQILTKPQSAVIRDLSAVARKSGYVNSGMESESEAGYMHRRKHRKQRSRSRSPSESKKGPPEELKKHFQYSLKDQVGLSTDQLRDIPYTKVETDAKPYKVKYSPNSRHKQTRTSASSISNGNTSSERKTSLRGTDEDGAPPPYTSNSAVCHGSTRSVMLDGRDGGSCSVGGGSGSGKHRFGSSPASSTRSQAARNNGQTTSGSTTGNTVVAAFAHSLDLLQPNQFLHMSNGSLTSSRTMLERSKKNSIEDLLGVNGFNSLNHEHSDSGLGTENQDRSGNSTGSYQSSASQSPNHFIPSQYHTLPSLPTTQPPYTTTTNNNTNLTHSSLDSPNSHHSLRSINGYGTNYHDHKPTTNYNHHHDTTGTNAYLNHYVPPSALSNVPNRNVHPSAKPPPPSIPTTNLNGSTQNLQHVFHGFAVPPRNQPKAYSGSISGANNDLISSSGLMSSQHNLMAFNGPSAGELRAAAARSPALSAINRHALPLHRQEIVKGSSASTLSLHSSIGKVNGLALMANGGMVSSASSASTTTSAATNSGGFQQHNSSFHRYPQSSLMSATPSHMSAYHANTYAPSYNWSADNPDSTNNDGLPSANQAAEKDKKLATNGETQLPRSENNHEMSTEL